MLNIKANLGAVLAACVMIICGQSVATADGDKQQNMPDTASLVGLPTPVQEVSGVRIGWYVNDALDAFKEAIHRNVPLVLVLYHRDCPPCVKMVRESLNCPLINRFAGLAVFALSEIGVDGPADYMRDLLKIESYPVMSFISPNPEILEELARIVGRFPPDQLSFHVENIFKEQGRVAPSASHARAELGRLGLAPAPMSCSVN